MPKPEGTLGNCYRLTIGPDLIGYFRKQVEAEIFWIQFRDWLNQSEYRFSTKMKVPTHKIELWYIEGEF